MRGLSAARGWTRRPLGTKPTSSPLLQEPRAQLPLNGGGGGGAECVRAQSNPSLQKLRSMESSSWRGSGLGDTGHSAGGSGAVLHPHGRMDSQPLASVQLSESGSRAVPLCWAVHGRSTRRHHSTPPRLGSTFPRSTFPPQLQAASERSLHKIWGAK